MTISSHCVEALRGLGYTSQESEFLYLVAIHSGYFTRRQFLSFTQAKPGNVSYKFISKLVRERLASFHPYRAGGRVYHLFSRKVYRAIESDNLSARRRHQQIFVSSQGNVRRWAQGAASAAPPFVRHGKHCYAARRCLLNVACSRASAFQFSRDDRR